MSEDSKKLLSPKAGYNQHTTPTAKPTIYLGFLKSMMFSGEIQTKLKPFSINS
jgi:hypothetical protein